LLSGIGIGLRPEHYQDFLCPDPPQVDWLEVLTDNYLVPGGKPLYFLEQIGARYPMAMHGVAMNLGSTDPLDFDYLSSVRSLVEQVGPHVVSDHLCWTGCQGVKTHDLLPLPYTEEAISHVAERIKRVQDFLGRRIAIENLSAYLEASTSIREWDFLSEIADRADCEILLDINNIYVSSRNQGFDPIAYIDAIDPRRVVQYHMAGHTDYGDYCIDTHDHPICESVFDLYGYALNRIGTRPTLIERDDSIPPLDELLTEAQRLKLLYRQANLVQEHPL
jgi:uncharacterized protein